MRSCLRLKNTKEGTSVRPVRLRVIDLLESLRPEEAEGIAWQEAAIWTGGLMNLSV